MHRVKCPVCNGEFDRDTVEWVKYGKARYAHKSCIEKMRQEAAPNNKTAPLSDLDLFRENALRALKDSSVTRLTIMDYCHWLFKGNANYSNIGSQLDKYINGYGFKQAGILKTLYWYYELTNHSPQEYNAIGIIPYIYAEAKKYFQKKHNADQFNLNYDVKNTLVKITIPPPQVKKKIKLMFQED